MEMSDAQKKQITQEFQKTFGDRYPIVEVDDYGVYFSDSICKFHAYRDRYYPEDWDFGIRFLLQPRPHDSFSIKWMAALKENWDSSGKDPLLSILWLIHWAYEHHDQITDIEFCRECERQINGDNALYW